MNKSDAERVASFLESIGFVQTFDEKEANLICAQACSVRQSAVDRIKGRVDRWRAEQKRRPASNFLMTALTGCVLPADRKIFEKQFDLVCETNHLRQELVQRINGLTTVPTKRLAGKNSVEITDDDFFALAPKYSSKFRSYIPIQTGCNNFCTYCAVPYTKGPEQYRPYTKIVQEVKNLVKQGYKEITLLGQNVNTYCDQVKSQKVQFADLLKLINDIHGDFWIRFISSNPWDMSDEIIKAVAECQKVCEYVHLPLQSGSDKILKKMNRRYSQKEYLTLVDKIRAQIPNVAVTCDIIVGFPCETEKDFLETAKVMEKVKFDMAYIARYSPRPGTVAARFMKDNVSTKEKKRRERELERILRQSALERNQEYVGREVEALVEKVKSNPPTAEKVKSSSQKSKVLFGKTRTFKTVKLMSDRDLTGQIIKVKITKIREFGLEGELLL